jgi:hypothetical protein
MRLADQQGSASANDALTLAQHDLDLASIAAEGGVLAGAVGGLDVAQVDNRRRRRRSGRGRER